MNHGFKIIGNILEITLPEEVRIDKVLVNRQMFSQRQRVCESCKYHGLEGHEEPCVSCEVGNSNYVSVEERTETHACDCVSRQAAIDVAKQHWYKPDIAKALKELPSAEPERKKGKWIKTYRGGFGRLMGYCNQCGVRSPVDNFCANCGADMRGEQDETNKAYTL